MVDATLRFEAEDLLDKAIEEGDGFTVIPLGRLSRRNELDGLPPIVRKVSRARRNRERLIELAALGLASERQCDCGLTGPDGRCPCDLDGT